MLHPKIEELLRQDSRYALEAYEFVFAALKHTQELHEMERDAGTEKHVTGQQLALGARDLARQEFGLMARAVFRAWGVNTTDDLGAIVFNLIETGLMSKTPQDNLADFHAVYDLDAELTKDYAIEVPAEDFPGEDPTKKAKDA